MKRMCFILITVMLIGFSCAWGENALSFGVVPQQSTYTILKKWTPLINELSTRSGVKLTLKTAPSIPEFEKRLAEGGYDIAYMNPYHYITYHEISGYRAFARERDKSIVGIVVVPSDSPYNSLHDLKEKNLAFPSTGAFAASMLVRSMLSEMGIPHSSDYVGSHDSVYLSVAGGIHDAGGGIRRTFNEVDASVSGELRILAETKSFTPHAFAARGDTKEELLDSLKGAMLSFHMDIKGRKLLDNAGLAGFISASDEDWNDIRSLGKNNLKSLLEK
ncbi:phosphate/phosphite/phosphonate ABC transporter substrate-binding protein [Limisalsivibrio acetivorans]|uniref:phosphate/phosphite/phosphonate ABC transporter substrate-binding protein n=1 Tax=Limisalsivibrio acetivorans TaxID=1304888 RepID=UPI0003B33F5F|nr:phosphate/phosphite/phosphonate ABC transporter substrate-binding protein [Limisalsivibrio acetivorans]